MSNKELLENSPIGTVFSAFLKDSTYNGWEVVKTDEFEFCERRAGSNNDFNKPNKEFKHFFNEKTWELCSIKSLIFDSDMEKLLK